jgi:hypothetical protein
MSNRPSVWAAVIFAGAIACGSDATSSGKPPIDKSVVISATAPSQHQQETALAQSGSRILVADDAGNFTLVGLGDGPHMGVFTFRIAAGARAFGVS